MSIIVAFDPGRNVGFAVVDASGRLLDHAVTRQERVSDLDWPVDAKVVLGAGTGSAELASRLQRMGCTVQPVDERGTSEIGRELWRRNEPARGWARWLPAGLRSPDRPIDDYAAWAIALRHLDIDVATLPEAAFPGRRRR